MATDPLRLSAQARTVFALATVGALAFVGIAAIIEVSFPGQENNGGPTHYTQQGSDYFAYIEVFGFPGWRLTGTWVTAHLTPPDEVRLVAGSDVARILAGQEPEHVYDTLEPWHEGGSIGTMNIRIPDFTCSGPNGGCEDGDLPALVFTRGSAWEGTPLSAVQTGAQSDRIANVGMTRNEGWVQPAIVTFAAFATVSALVSIAAGILWWREARRNPPGPLPALQGDAPLEMSLRIVDLSRLYLGSITRSLYIGGAIVLLGGLALQLFALPALDELHDNFYPLGAGEAKDAWFSLVHWWIIPYSLIVAAVFWVRQLRQLRAEQQRWSSIAGRLSTLEQQVLG